MSLPRDWPPDDQPPAPKTPPPKIRVLIMLMIMLALIFGSPLLAWLITVLPGDHPYAAAIVPLAWIGALLVFLVGSTLDIRSRR